MTRRIPDRKNDIYPRANYTDRKTDRKSCFSIYFYTDTVCFNCPKLKECEKQNDEEYPPEEYSKERVCFECRQDAQGSDPGCDQCNLNGEEEDGE